MKIPTPNHNSKRILRIYTDRPTFYSTYNIHVTYKKHVTNSCGAELFSKIKYLK